MQNPLAGAHLDVQGELIHTQPLSHHRPLLCAPLDKQNNTSHLVRTPGCTVRPDPHPAAAARPCRRPQASRASGACGTARRTEQHSKWQGATTKQAPTSEPGVCRLRHSRQGSRASRQQISTLKHTLSRCACHCACAISEQRHTGAGSMRASKHAQHGAHARMAEHPRMLPRLPAVVLQAGSASPGQRRKLGADRHLLLAARLAHEVAQILLAARVRVKQAVGWVPQQMPAAAQQLPLASTEDD